MIHSPHPPAGSSFLLPVVFALETLDFKNDHHVATAIGRQAALLVAPPDEVVGLVLVANPLPLVGDGEI